MNETSKLNKYRMVNGYDKYFTGSGIDIGCGSDVLSKEVFRGITSVRPYDLDSGDAQSCSNIEDSTFDFVYSSHCLEHMVDPHRALEHWVRIRKPGGYVVVAVPHEVYYEKCHWPSMFNSDHKHSFRIEDTTVMPQSIFVMDMLSGLEGIEVVSCDLIVNFDMNRFWEDQTLGDGICQIEFIIKKDSSEPQ